MFSIFTKVNDFVRYPITRYGNLNYVFDKCLDDLDVYKAYYRQRNSKVNNSNIFVKLIKRLDNASVTSFIGYMKYVQSDSEHAGKFMGVVSTISKGKVLEGVVIDGDREIFMSRDIDSDIDIFNFEYIWREYAPLKVIKHNDNNCSITHPDKSMSSGGVAVYTIDIVGMMLQYRLWRKHRISLGYNTDPAVYIYQYLFTNMVDSYLDLSFFNRFMTYINFGMRETHTDRNPFRLHNNLSKIDSVLEDMMEDLANQPKDLVGILRNIPGIIEKDAFEISTSGVTLLNSNNTWAFVESRIEWVHDLLLLLGERGIRKNTKYTGRLAYNIKKMYNAKQLSGSLNKDETDYTDMMIDNIKEMLK